MSPEASRLREAGHRLAEKITNTLRQGAFTNADRALQLAVDCENSDPLTWLSAQRNDVKLYWQNREGDCEMAGVGVADSVSTRESMDITSAIERIRSILPDGEPDIRYLGGLSFDSNREIASDGPWRAFGNGQFVLPRFLFIRVGDSTRLACNIVPASENSTSIDGIVETCRGLAQPNNTAHEPAAVVARQDDPGQRGWTTAVEKALDRIDRGELSKVVLARATHLELDSEVNPWMLLTALRASGSQQYLFGMQFRPGRAFVGATPERLYRREEGTIFTEALAGTRPRGADRPEDERLATELLQCDKDRREHRIVLDSVTGHLHMLCEHVEKDGNVTIKKTPGVQHLLACLSGRLKSGVTDTDILAALHPTPAVGGLPKEPALRFIAELESFHRGWYAGPVGWIGSGGAEFAVAIRSALVHTTEVILFSGAGIVAGSNPASEWQEIENKIAGFLKVLIKT